MGQHITNNLQGVNIGGNSVINDFNPSMEEHIKESNNKTIFLSYNWHDGEIADRIDKHLSSFSNITVKKDMR